MPLPLHLSLLAVATTVEVDADWLDALTRLADDRAPANERVDAAALLVQAADERAIPVLRTAVRGREDSVRAAVLEQLGGWPHPEILRLLEEAATDTLSSQPARATALRSLGELGLEEAGEVLWTAAGSSSMPAELRSVARQELEEHYPELLAERGPPATSTDPIGATAGVVGNGLAGGILMSSVGVWGRTDTGVVVGAIGGGVIGAGTAGLYAGFRSVDRGQGLLYASNVGWGLTSGVMLSNATFGRTGTPPAGTDTKAKVSALYRSAGVASGAAIALARFDADPTTEDVLSLDASGWIGTQLALGIADLTQPGEDPEDCWELEGSTGDACYSERMQAAERRRNAMGLGGLAAGLGTAIAVQDAWQPTWKSGLFSSVVAAETGWIGGWLPTALGQAEPTGNVRAALHAGAAGGLLLDHHFPRSPRSSAQTLYGGLVGNAIGAGIPMLADAPAQTQVSVMLPVGAAGTLAGGLLGDRLQLSSGDLSMIGVGTTLTTVEATTIGFILDERGVWSGPSQRAGLTFTAAGLAGAGFQALGTQVEPEVGDMLFLGSAAGWGATYGVLTPIALRTEGDGADLALVTLLTADTFVATGALLMSPLVELDPRDSLLPQVCAVGGATLGTLGVSFASDDPAHLATGAVVGTTLGFVGGGVARASLPRRKRVASGPPLPTGLARLPGSWHTSLHPTVLDDGATGVAARLEVVDW